MKNKKESKVWKERHIYFKSKAKTVILPNENENGILLVLSETDETNLLDLTYNEAKELGKQLISFAEENL